MNKKIYLSVLITWVISGCSSEETDRELIEEAVEKIPYTEPMFMPVNANGEETIHCLSKAIAKKVGDEYYVIGVPLADSEGRYDCRNYVPEQS
ncbi:hypothetical protein [Microbulbifer epialgicus]|uniref:Uncharacterized protein n=1 Tax=Microbulbifer epialgicus TaxID=393907 RepID=A0ABV4NUU5_9GAMM